MAYIWKYQPGNELQEGEENDLQVCIPLIEQENFKRELESLNIGEDYSLILQQLPSNSPYHIDNPKSNFHMDNVSFEKLIVVKADGPNTIDIHNSEVILRLNDDGIRAILSTMEETNRSPSLYENTLPLLKDSNMKLNFWGSYEGIPIYF